MSFSGRFASGLPVGPATAEQPTQEEPMSKFFLLALGSVLALLPTHVQAQTRQPPVRIHTFDQRGNRQGYSVYDPNSGRYDSFSKDGRRTGYGTATQPSGDPNHYERRYEIDRQRQDDQSERGR